MIYDLNIGRKNFPGAFRNPTSFDESPEVPPQVSWLNQKSVFQIKGEKGFALEEGQIAFLMNSSKAIRLKALNSIFSDSESSDVTLDGISLNSLSEKERRWVRRHRFSLIEEPFAFVDLLNAIENVEYALRSLGLDLVERRRRAEEALKKVGLWEHRFRRPHQMEVLMKWKVSFAQVLARQLRLVGLSDPLWSLTLGRVDENSSETCESFVTWLKEMAQRENMAFVISAESENSVFCQASDDLIPIHCE